MASSTQPYSADTCMFCHESLRIIAEPEFPEDDVDASSEPPSTIIDDVELYCGPPGSGPSGHHAHWTCLIDDAKSRSTSDACASLCAVCGQKTLNAQGRCIVDVRNEGGETKGFDFGEILEEELFLEVHPDQVHARAFHDLVAEGDYEGAIQLMTAHHVDVNCTFGTDGLTALQKAMFSGDVSGADFLRGLGARA